MRARCRPLLPLVALLVAACSGGGGSGKTAPSSTSGPRRASTTTTTTGVIPSSADLATALLAVQDMPTGWGIPPPDDSSSSSGDSPLCDGTKSAVANMAGEQEIQYSRGGYLPVFAESLAAAASAAQAKELFATTRAQFESCVGKTWTETDENGAVTTYTLGPVSLPAVGDEHVALRLTASTDFGALNVDLLLFRSGAVIGFLGSVGGSIAFIGGGTIEPAEFTTIVDTAEQKLDALLHPT